VGEPKSVLD
jgi:steroid delta-isomerase-like uncharacterized protein